MAENSGREIVVCEDAEALSRDAAHRFVSLAAQKTNRGEKFTVALSGGSTPKLLFGLLASASWQDALDWSRIEIFFGDERAVPPDHADSNYRMASESLLTRVPIPAENIHRMEGEATDLQAAAERYETTLRNRFGLSSADALPRFDLILLGMGPDGHTASLFPHKSSLHERSRLVVVGEPGRSPFLPRLTFTFPILNNAANLLFLVAGEDKRETLERVLHGPSDPESLPSQQVSLTDGSLVWLLDRAAQPSLR